MHEKVLDEIIKLFVIFSKYTLDESGFAIRSFLEVFLARNFSAETVEKYINAYDSKTANYTFSYAYSEEVLENDRITLNEICNEINTLLESTQKIKIAIQIIDLLNYLNSNASKNDDAISLIRFVLLKFRISDELTNNMLALSQGQIQKIQNKSDIIVASGIELGYLRSIKTHYVEHLKGKIYFYFIREANLFTFYLDANDELELSGQPIIMKRVYFLEKHDSIKGKHIAPIYHSSILVHFLKHSGSNITLSVDKVSYNFPNSNAGIKEVSLTIKSGELVAIMGGSGSGKTTCLNLFCGNLKPKSGTVKINGIDVYSKKRDLKGLIGFVPQDDFLFGELSVFENLFFNASLCNTNLSKDEIEELVHKTLKTLNLFEIRDLVVGTQLNNIISGGQRKRLNIALELVREPYILFLDEPTSGLSSADSELLIDLLKGIAMNGKIVVLNIHQPSSDIYKLFDKLLILDKLGYPIYFGNQIYAIEYLKSTLKLADASRSECSTCGYINPEQIFNLIEWPKLDRKGNKLHYRLVSPINWHQRFEKNINSENINEAKQLELPKNNLKIPNKFKQFLIFAHRNLKSKFADKQYLLFGLIEAPLLGIILGFSTRYTDPLDLKYSFSNNENIPAFLFMSVLVALFLGMIISAEEIIKDRKILKREALLNLSKVSFINAKIIFLFTLSAIQISSFLIISSSILEIKGQFWSYFLILWITACFANMVGLLLSSIFKSKVAIYVAIPFILIPQILLAGTIVPFDKLNGLITTQEFVPLIGDLMASRWAYEAIAVDQFVSNKYYKDLYIFDKKRADATYIANYLIPELEHDLAKYYPSKDLNKKAELQILIEQGFRELNKNFPDICTNLDIMLLKGEPITKYALLKSLKDKTIREIEYTNSKKDQYLAMYNKKDIMSLKESHWNNKLSETLMANDRIRKIIPYNQKLVRKFQPIYFNATNNFGRAHFYAPNKTLGKMVFTTFIFNIIVLIIMTITIYLILLLVNITSNRRNPFSFYGKKSFR